MRDVMLDLVAHARLVGDCRAPFWLRLRGNAVLTGIVVEVPVHTEDKEATFLSRVQHF